MVKGIATNALAIGNFVIGGLGVLATLLALESAGRSAAIAVTLALGAIAAGLAIASGVGLRRRRRVLGRWVGTSYAAVALAHGACVTFWLHAGLGWHVVTTLGYPAVTAVLLHTVLARELAR